MPKPRAIDYFEYDTNEEVTARFLTDWIDYAKELKAKSKPQSEPTKKVDRRTAPWWPMKFKGDK
jgi:hypothetical protein